MADTNKITPFGDKNEYRLSHSKNRANHFLNYDDNDDAKLAESQLKNYEKAFEIAEKFNYAHIYEGISISEEYPDKLKTLKDEKDQDIADFIKFANKLTNEELNKIFKNNPVHFKYSGILYPPALLYLYESSRYGYTIRFIEEKCNKILNKFIKDLKGQALYEYTTKFIASLTDAAKFLGNARALIATFGKSDNSADNLNLNHKNEFATNVGADESITYEDAFKLLEKASKYSNSEDQILGRILYILIWNSIEKPGTQHKLLP